MWILEYEFISFNLLYTLSQQLHFIMVTGMNFFGGKALPLIQKQLFKFVIKWSWLG